MKTAIKNALMGMMALLVFFISSCSKHAADKTGSLPLTGQRADLGWLLSDNCTFLDTTITGTRTASPSSVYGNWAPANFAIPGSNLVLKLEGIYSSFFRPDTVTFNKWYIGLVDSTLLCNGWFNFASSIIVKNSFIGSDPSGNGRYNVVGYDGTISPYSFGRGYYEYASVPPYAFTPKYAIVVWKDISKTTPLQVSDPTDVDNVTEAYALKVQSITPVSGTPVQSIVAIKYGQVL